MAHKATLSENLAARDREASEGVARAEDEASWNRARERVLGLIASDAQLSPREKLHFSWLVVEERPGAPEPVPLGPAHHPRKRAAPGGAP